MKVFSASRTSDYDEFGAFIIVAKNITIAKQLLHAELMDHFCGDSYENEFKLTEIDLHIEGIIAKEFHAG